MGVVYRAHDPMIRRDVAIKVLPAELTANETALQRFLAEAQATGKLNHPHTVAIYEIGEENGTYYLVMEFVSGGSVASYMERVGVPSVLHASRMLADACEGVGAAHAAGLIHRDIKPANLLIAADGAIKVGDFGLAKPSLNESHQLTHVGQVLGSPYFMSPEQCESGPVDARSDIYSLGATYYTLLTGANPYADSGSIVQIMMAHCQADPPDPRLANPAIPAACSLIVARAMAKRPEDRYQSAREMLADLQAVIATLSGEVSIELPSESGPRSAVVPSRRGATGSTSRDVPNSAMRNAAIAVACVLAFASAFFARWAFKGYDGRVAGRGDNAGAVPVPVGEPIKVGVLHSLTGTMAESGSAVVDATLLAIEEINQAGGVLGRPVEAVVRDGRSDPHEFLVQAESLINEEKVAVVFGCWTSSGRKTVVPIFEQYDHLLVYPVQYEGMEESPNVIYLGATPNQQIIPAVKWTFTTLKKRRYFLIGSDYVFPCAANEVIKDQLKQLGAELVGEVYLAPEDTNLDEAIAQIKEAQPDAILNTINGDSNHLFFRALRKAGIQSENVVTVSFSLGAQELRQLNPSEVAGDYAAWTYFASIATPENEQFIKRFHDKYGPQRVVTDPMEAAYAGVKLWAAAVEDAETTDPNAVRHAMRAQRITAPSGPLRIDPTTQHAFKIPRIGRINASGEFEIVWTSPQVEPPEPFPKERPAAEWKAFLHDLHRSWGDQWAAPAVAP